MRNADLENLIRIALEIEDFSRDAATGRPVPGTRPPLRSTVRARSIRILRAVPLAAAAAVTLFLALPTVRKTHTQDRLHRVRAEACYQAGTPRSDASRLDLVQSTVSEPASLVAILRTWNSDCDCLLWKLHHWEDGATLVNASPGEPLNLAVDVKESSVEQVVFLAFARDSKALRADTEVEADRLVECLNRSALYDGVCADPSASSAAVGKCLPTGVTILKQTLASR